MIVTIHQPDFLPWLGFFNKVRLSDLLVIGDHVQYRNKGYQNRNRIKTIKGWQWLTVPIVHNWGSSINEMMILNREQNGITWDDLHLRTLQVNYGKAPFYDTYIGIFEKIYKRRIEMLAECNLEFLKAIFSILGIDIPIKRTSEMNMTGSKTDLIVEICKAVGADTYLSGMKGARYMEESTLEQNGVKLLYNNYEHPVYEQQFMEVGFEPNMSVIDLIFNHGPQSFEIIKSGFKGFELLPGQQQKIKSELEQE
ncbi:MAG: WbqC family protein [Thaumarchaeota archaeon]|nr:WbqC family protein [Nitrososphaerota archaeon]